jgi:hypothetical protein
MGLDVVRVVAEALEADEVVRRLPDNAGDGHLGHHAQHHDLGTLHYVHRARAIPQNDNGYCYDYNNDFP